MFRAQFGLIAVGECVVDRNLRLGTNSGSSCILGKSTWAVAVCASWL